jgi:predicted RNA binding protein YcfA (HicA-like mRNA interferase family)
LTKHRLAADRDVRRVAEAAGFASDRRQGSHHACRNADGRNVVIPDHGPQVIVRPLLRKILCDLGLSVEG